MKFEKSITCSRNILFQSFISLSHPNPSHAHGERTRRNAATDWAAVSLRNSHVVAISCHFGWQYSARYTWQLEGMIPGPTQSWWPNACQLYLPAAVRAAINRPLVRWVANWMSAIVCALSPMFTGAFACSCGKPGGCGVMFNSLCCAVCGVVCHTKDVVGEGPVHSRVSQRGNDGCNVICRRCFVAKVPKVCVAFVCLCVCSFVCIYSFPCLLKCLIARLFAFCLFVRVLASFVCVFLCVCSHEGTPQQCQVNTHLVCCARCIWCRFCTEGTYLCNSGRT